MEIFFPAYFDIALDHQFLYKTVKVLSTQRCSENISWESRDHLVLSKFNFEWVWEFQTLK